MTTTENPTQTGNQLKMARIAVSSAFAIAGFILAVWVVNIPAVETRTGISHGTLGSLLLFIGLGAFIGMQISGFLTDRVGSKLVTLGGGLLSTTSLILPGLATNAPMLAVALFIFGFAHGSIDVGMNSQAVVVERLYKRPIMSSFHALFSLGGAVGAGLGAAMIALDVQLIWSLTAAAAVGVAGLALIARHLVAHEKPAAASRQQGSKNRMSRSVWLLGATAFLLMLAEGVANDWSALQIKQHLNQPEALAAFGYAAFSVTMTVGRLLADRIVASFGAIRVVRYGALIGALGLLTVILAPALWLNLVGWGLLGLGLSGCVPQIFTAAGNLPDGTQGVNISRVVGMGYLGLLAGPAVIGWVSQVSSITEALIIPLVFCGVVALIAGALRPAKPN